MADNDTNPLIEAFVCNKNEHVTKLFDIIVSLGINSIVNMKTGFIWNDSDYYTIYHIKKDPDEPDDSVLKMLHMGILHMIYYTLTDDIAVYNRNGSLLTFKDITNLSNQFAEEITSYRQYIALYEWTGQPMRG